MKLVQHCFEKLAFNRVWLTVSSTNARGVASYDKLGFSKQGVVREAAYRDETLGNTPR